MSDVSGTTTETQPHEVDALHRFLTIVAAKLPWHSEAEQNDALDLLRQSEADLKGDDIETSPAVVPPASAAPAGAVTAPVITGPTGPAPAGIDYDQLASAIARQQQAAAAEQMAQAHEATVAAPDFTPPGAETAPAAVDTEAHAAVDQPQ